MAVEATLPRADLCGKPQYPLGLPGILREALGVGENNRRLAATVSLLLLAPSCFINWARDRALLPMVDDDRDDGEGFPGRGSLGRLLILEAAFFVAAAFVSLSVMALTVNVASTAYISSYRHRLVLKDAVTRTLALWKRPAFTCLCVVAITVGYAFLVGTLLGVLSLVAAGEALVATAAILVFSAALLYAFLSVVWVLGFAVSVLEDGCCGMNALARAARLVRGRRLVGFLLASLLLLLGTPIAMLLHLNTREDDQGGPATRAAVGIAATAAAGLLKMFAFTAFTVFYYECRMHHGEKPEDDGGRLYEMLTM